LPGRECPHTAVEAAIVEARRWVRIQQGTKTEHE
jgi:hypothetical protein